MIYDAAVHLSMGDVRVDCRAKPTYLEVVIKHILHLSWKLRDSPGFALTKSVPQRICRSLLFVPKMFRLSQLHYKQPVKYR